MEKCESRTVYFLVKFVGGGPGHGLYEVKIERGKILGKLGGLLDPLCKFFDRSNPEIPKEYLLSATRFGSRSGLYLLQHEGPGGWWLRESSTRSHNSYEGRIFDTMSKKLMPFKKMPSVKKAAVLISAYGKLYHLAHFWSNAPDPDPSFEVYDPDAGFWTKLPRLPYDGRYLIAGYALCCDCILISMWGHTRGNFWVYQVTLDQWKQIIIPTEDANDICPFHGRAVVVGDTIYALSFYGSIIAYSMIMEKLADGSLKFSLGKQICLCGLHSLFLRDPECSPRTQCLVHLGGLNFCLFQTVSRDFTTQRVWITTFDIVSSGGRKLIRTLDSTMRKVAIKGLGQFRLEYSGFCLECEDLEPKGKETMATSSKMQPTDAPQLHMHEKAKIKIIKRQIQKQRRKMMNHRSKRLAAMQKLFMS
ncbi:uncharacterized protein LOC126794699 [Argentina anserina]|uniref:uncharacterized protein LOC126794699 n=1 Tax=Argentina anserina TaxID=57926 RepID=UPI0021765CBD|nr:uncharacterized protein LOC126794699 [Potentilla anserina]